MSTRIILHNIRSAHNVGSIFRTADGAGVERIYLSGYTPHPLDRFGRVQPEIQKTSLGANESVAWETVDDLSSLITKLQRDGWTVVAVEQDNRAVSWFDFRTPEKVAYIFGNETEGIEHPVLDLVDVIVEIPMQGMKESLNVSVAAGIVLFSK